MKKAILLLAPLALAYGCSQDRAHEARAADRTAGAGTQSTTKSYDGAGQKTPSGTAAPAPAPDNTKINVRDREGDTLTPTDQQENETDLALTQKLRQALVADDTLSITAQNIKIISLNGTVTLRGPVKDQSEKDKIETEAKAVAGVTNVDNQLEVKGS